MNYDDEDNFQKIPRKRKSNRPIRKRCQFAGKHSYPTRNVAEYQMNTLVAMGRTDFLRVYRCPNCHQWHLTSKPQKK